MGEFSEDFYVYYNVSRPVEGMESGQMIIPVETIIYTSGLENGRLAVLGA